MNMIYQTKRLELRIITDEEAPQVLQFYLDNQEIFERYEVDRMHNFYTEKFQRTVLQCEYNLAVKQKLFRFWVYEKGNIDRIIGTVSIYDIKRGYYQSCELGYKFDQRFWGKGYAKESVLKCLQIAFEELELHRVEAYVVRENEASRKLLKSMGFGLEGVKRQSVKLHGVWQDHELYALLAEEIIHSDSGTSNQTLLC
ncbi:MAG: GNAT family N-acetyltransferase [Lachnospiraceae bacterium]|nr:GNAT family N-acetyltransferase [Lachnospiraceae bacterium]